MAMDHMINTLLAQVQPLTQQIAPGLIDKWTEADSINVVLAILSLALFVVAYWLLRVNMKRSDQVQELILTIQETHTAQTKELQEVIRSLATEQTKTTLEVTHALNTLTALIKERIKPN